MPIHTYTNWNSRHTDQEEQIEPFRKYYFICEGANTETFYFKKLIDIKKELGIHSLIDIRLWEKTGEDRKLSYPKNLALFAEQQKSQDDDFDETQDKMIIVFDGDIFEERVEGYNELIATIEEKDIAAIANPCFELFLLLHVEESYNNYIKGHEIDFFTRDEKGRLHHAYDILLELTGMNAKTNPNIGKLADKIHIAIVQEKLINQDIHDIKGKVSSNIGKIIEEIINEKPFI